MGFCDGKHFVPLPDTRDYKRAFDDDRGRTLAVWGSYKDAKDYLPFLTALTAKPNWRLSEKVFKGLEKTDSRRTPHSAESDYTLLLCIRAKASRSLKLTVDPATLKS